VFLYVFVFIVLLYFVLFVFFWVFFTFVAFFSSVLWCYWLGLLTCNTVSQTTYAVLVETSINQSKPVVWCLMTCIQRHTILWFT